MQKIKTYPDGRPREEWALFRRVRIKKGLFVDMTMGPSGFVCEWDPDKPMELKPHELATYQKARNELIGQVAARMGGGILIVDL